MRRWLIGLLVAVGFAASAEALTLRDLMELSRAGLGDEVLLALIEVDRGVYDISPDSLKRLKAAGVSDRVIAALVRSGRDVPAVPVPPAEPPAGAPVEGPQVLILEHHPQPVVREVAMPVPVYVTAPVSRGHRSVKGRLLRPHESTFVPFQSGPPPQWPRQVEEPREPVYWGFGGKRRPDAWEPEKAASAPDEKRGDRGTRR